MLILYRKGIADEHLAKKAAERGRQSLIERPNGLPKNSRSRSSYSSTSVSTISTNLSRSPRSSTKDTKLQSRGLPLSSTENRGNQKRRRSSTRSSMSYTTCSSFSKQGRNHSRELGRNIRRRRASRSPNSRGRDRNHSRRRPEKKMGGSYKRRRDSVSSSSSHSSASSFERKRRDRSRDENFPTGHHHSSISPDSRGRDRNFYGKRSNRRSRSHSYSRDRSQVARNRQSMTPGAPPQWNGGRNTPKISDALTRDRGYRNDNDRYGGSFRGSNRGNPGTAHFSQPRRKERSLSPFSKRVALTQAMNTSN